MAAPSDNNFSRRSSTIRRDVDLANSIMDDDSWSDSEGGSDLNQNDFESDDSDCDLDYQLPQNNPANNLPALGPQNENNNHNARGDFVAPGRRAAAAAAVANPNDASWTRVADLQQDQPPQIFDFTGGSEQGPVFAPAEADPVQYFERFFSPTDAGSPSLWETLVSETNKYKHQYDQTHPVLKRRSRLHDWTDVTVPEMKAFIACILNMGINRKHTIEAYWDSSNWSQSLPMFKQVFTLDRFKLILRFFHVSDNYNQPEQHDQIYKFRTVLEHFNKKWSAEYRLARDLAIDESIVGFKGRHSLVNYIRIKKHHQWGPKEYNLCDSRFGYCFETLYHTREMPKGDFGKPYEICRKLMEPHADKYHHLVVDSYYNSVALCEQMLLKKTYVTGTIQPNRVRLPSDMKTKLKQKGDAIANRKGNLLALSWVDRKQVRLLTSCSSANKVEKEIWNGTKILVPQAVLDYNCGMGGVDLTDQMTDHYAGEFRTVKLWKKVVFHLIDRTLTNSYVCYKTNPNVQGKRLDHLKFIIKVVEGLIGDYSAPRKRMGRPSLLIPAARKTERHFVEKIPDGKRRKCVVCCQKRADGFKGSRITTWCKDCGVGLCKGDCFISYHK